MFKAYFAILTHQNGGLVPMVDEDSDLATFETPEECAFAAQNTILGAHFGYEVFCSGCGEITR